MLPFIHMLYESYKYAQSRQTMIFNVNDNNYVTSIHVLYAQITMKWLYIIRMDCQGYTTFFHQF